MPTEPNSTLVITNQPFSTIQSVGVIMVAVVGGVLLYWLFQQEVVIAVMSGVLGLSLVAIGALAARVTFKFMSPRFPRWVRLTTSIIVGVSILLTLEGLLFSGRFTHFLNDASIDR